LVARARDCRCRHGHHLRSGVFMSGRPRKAKPLRMIALQSPSGKILPITEMELRGDLLPGYRIVRVPVTEE
jgi:hypothetical protein